MELMFVYIIIDSVIRYDMYVEVFVNYSIHVPCSREYFRRHLLICLLILFGKSFVIRVL